MTKNKVQRIVAMVLVAVAVVMAVVGGIHLPQRNGEGARTAVKEMRIRTLLDVTGVGLVDTYVEIAREEAMAAGKAAGLSLKERKAQAEIAMEEARAQYENQEIDYSAMDTSKLEAPVADYAAKLETYYQMRAAAVQSYVEANMAAAEAKAEAERQAKIDAGEEVGEEKAVTVDVSSFDKMVKALAAIDPASIPEAAAVTEKLFAAQAELESAYAALRDVIAAPCGLTAADVNAVRGEIDKAIIAGKPVYIGYNTDAAAVAVEELPDSLNPIEAALAVYMEKQAASMAADDAYAQANEPVTAASAAREAATKAADAYVAAKAAANAAFTEYMALQRICDEAIAPTYEQLSAAQDAHVEYMLKETACAEAAEADAARKAELKAAEIRAADAEKLIEEAKKVVDAVRAELEEAYTALSECITADFALVETDSFAAMREKIKAAVKDGKAVNLGYKPVLLDAPSAVHADTGFDQLAAVYAEKLLAVKALEKEASGIYAAAKIDALLKVRPEAQAELRKLPEDIAMAVQLTAALAEADEYFKPVGEALKEVYPVLDDASLKTLKSSITNVVLQQGEDYTALYDRYRAAGSGEALSNPIGAALIRFADDLLYGALALVVTALIILFYETLSKKLGIPRIVLGVFFILLCFMCLWFDLSLATLLSNSLVRMGMNAVMVLAMVPGIQCGISLNLGLPIGLVAGLIGGLVTIEWGIPGVWGFVVAILVGCVIAAVCGWLYAQLLNRLKGEEMSVTTYVGFSIVSLMCIAWLVLPFQSLKLRWPMGTGLRNTIGLDSTNFKHVLDDFLAFDIGGFTVPTGLLLFMLLMCFLVWVFTRTKTGVAMSAVGNNPRFAEATGINVDKMRVIGTVLSTVLGAIGILVYSQSYGFMQLYTAPRQMGFIAASAILIGGASTSRCKISHVLIGTFLFQGVLTLGMPVANVLVPGSTISETLRILISNGIILYALTKSGGESRA